MKKLIVLLSLITFNFGFSQEQEVELLKKNELKINAIFLVGGAIFIALTDELTQEFSLTGFYRFYFGKKIASGFFIEGFGSLNQFDNSDDYTESYNSNGYRENIYNKNYSTEVITDFALGFGAGSKWVTKKGFVFELYAAVGRNLFNGKSEDYDNEIMGRGGINIGYRF